jgi:hypothetical protein
VGGWRPSNPNSGSVDDQLVELVGVIRQDEITALAWWRSRRRTRRMTPAWKIPAHHHLRNRNFIR